MPFLRISFINKDYPDWGTKPLYWGGTRETLTKNHTVHLALFLSSDPGSFKNPRKRVINLKKHRLIMAASVSSGLALMATYGGMLVPITGTLAITLLLYAIDEIVNGE